MSLRDGQSNASLIEAARKHGGEKAVEQLKAAFEAEDVFRAALVKLVAEAVDKAKPDDIDSRRVIYSAISEALSTALAEAVVEFGEAMDHDKIQMTLISVRSVVGNIDLAYENREAKKAGIGDKIKALFKVGRGEK